MSDDVRLVWATPNADETVAYCARVSNPVGQHNDQIEGLLRYCGRHGHWSVFEMANMVVEINTTRDIARQILRHRSLSFQEFSQRYAAADQLGDPVLRDARLQDTKNRQNSIPLDMSTQEHRDLARHWHGLQQQVMRTAMDNYRWALSTGIAKEVARALLPEGLTASRLYANGTLRSWVHYLQQRLDPATQLEHRDVAKGVLVALREAAPVVARTFFGEMA